MTRAQYNLGLMYAAGEGVPANSVKAYAWLSLAAADGDPAAKKLADFIWSKTTTEAQKETLKKVAADLATKIKK
jgi:TPR repeat protein